MHPADRIPRLWTLWAAARPSQLALIVLVYALGVGMVAAGEAGPTGRAPPASAELAALSTAAVVPLLIVAIAVHYANEYADVDTDAIATRTPFSGGSGALVRTDVPRSFLARGIIVTTLAGAASALLVRLTVGLDDVALVLLAAILALGLAYSLQPLALIRRGVGELVNVVLGGLLLPLYGVAVAGVITPTTVVAVVPFALVVSCNLFATHWADRDADARVGKRTLAVRFSSTRLRRSYATIAAVAALWTVAIAGSVLPPVVTGAHALALPFLVWGGLVLTRQRSPFPAVAAMVVLAAATTVAWWASAFG